MGVSWRGLAKRRLRSPCRERSRLLGGETRAPRPHFKPSSFSAILVVLAGGLVGSLERRGGRVGDLPVGLAHIRLTRKRQYGAVARFIVLLDGENVGSRSIGGLLMLTTTPGHHTLALRQMRFQSNSYQVELEDGEPLDVSCAAATAVQNLRTAPSNRDWGGVWRLGLRILWTCDEAAPDVVPAGPTSAGPASAGPTQNPVVAGIVETDQRRSRSGPRPGSPTIR